MSDLGDREGGSEDRIPPKKHLEGMTETQLYGSSWEKPAAH